MKKALNKRFNQWLHGSTGNALQRIEFKVLRKLKRLDKVDNLVLLGEPEQQGLFKAFHAKHNILITDQKVQNQKDNDVIYASHDELPLRPNSIDCILLPHTLDYTKSLHHTLREANICLQPEGHLVILGFNPYSLWGLRRLFTMRINTPWCGHFYPSWRIRDALVLLNYQVTTTKKFVYRPHARRFGLFRKMAFLESFFRLLFPFSGAVYLIVAKKKVFGKPPLKRAWQRVPSVISNGVVNPTRTAVEREQTNG